MNIRQETIRDYEQVFHVVEKAFEQAEFSDQTEKFLVERLRSSEAFIPELSLVAEIEEKIVGHILLTRLKINSQSKTLHSLALAPVSVLPEYQGRGIGSKLILEAHRIARLLGYTSIILLGHQDYYPRFGYLPAHHFGIELPFDVPKENCMAIELIENGLKEVTGLVEYPQEFNS